MGESYSNPHNSATQNVTFSKGRKRWYHEKITIVTFSARPTKTLTNSMIGRAVYQQKLIYSTNYQLIEGILINACMQSDV